jgi:malonate transporter
MPRHALAFYGKLFLVLALASLSVFCFGLIVEVKRYKFTPADSSAILLTVSSPNFVAVGFPLFIALYGPLGTVPVGVAILCGNLLIVPLALLLLETESASKSHASILSRYATGLWRSVRNPIVVGPALGLCLSLGGYTLSPVWVRSFGYFGESVAGVALFITGLVLARESLSVDFNVLGALLMKLILQPLLAFVIASLLLHYPSQIVRDAVLLMACPCGFFGILFALTYNARTREAESVLLLSTAASVLTLSAIIPLLSLIR